MVTLYDALVEKLKKHGLQWNDIEAIVVNSGGVKVYDGEEGGRAFQRSELLLMYPRNPYVAIFKDIRPFYAYTKERIFYVGLGDEFGTYWIGSLPRNPTKNEGPVHLPT